LDTRDGRAKLKCELKPLSAKDIVYLEQFCWRLWLCALACYDGHQRPFASLEGGVECPDGAIFYGFRRFLPERWS
jgi:hypothetical protein